jgi:SAM-dependent methyltransferase
MSLELKYLDLYPDQQDNPTPVKAEGGLSGFWSILPQDHSAKTWGINESFDEFEQSALAETGSGFHRGIDRSVKFIDFMVRQGFKFSDKQIADIGCGEGKLSILMSHAGSQVMAVDPSQKQLAILKHLDRHSDTAELARDYLATIDDSLIYPIQGLIYPRQCRAEKTPFADKLVDAVTMKFALQWTDDLQTLKEVNRILKPGGSLFIMTTSPQPGQPDLFCRAWNSLVTDLEQDGETFKNLQSPRNPIPMHHLPGLVEHLEKNGLILQAQESALELTGKNPAIFVAFLMRIFGDQLRFCLEGSHNLDDTTRNKMLVERMNKLKGDQEKLARIEENIVLLHFKKARK